MPRRSQQSEAETPRRSARLSTKPRKDLSEIPTRAAAEKESPSGSRSRRSKPSPQKPAQKAKVTPPKKTPTKKTAAQKSARSSISPSRKRKAEEPADDEPDTKTNRTEDEEDTMEERQQEASPKMTEQKTSEDVGPSGDTEVDAPATETKQDEEVEGEETTATEPSVEEKEEEKPEDNKGEETTELQNKESEPEEEKEEPMETEPAEETDQQKEKEVKAEPQVTESITQKDVEPLTLSDSSPQVPEPVEETKDESSTVVTPPAEPEMKDLSEPQDTPQKEQTPDTSGMPDKAIVKETPPTSMVATMSESPVCEKQVSSSISESLVPQKQVSSVPESLVPPKQAQSDPESTPGPESETPHIPEPMSSLASQSAGVSEPQDPTNGASTLYIQSIPDKSIVKETPPTSMVATMSESPVCEKQVSSSISESLVPQKQVSSVPESLVPPKQAQSDPESTPGPESETPRIPEPMSSPASQSAEQAPQKGVSPTAASTHSLITKPEQAPATQAPSLIEPLSSVTPKEPEINTSNAASFNSAVIDEFAPVSIQTPLGMEYLADASVYFTPPQYIGATEQFNPVRDEEFRLLVTDSASAPVSDESQVTVTGTTTQKVIPTNGTTTTSSEVNANTTKIVTPQTDDHSLNSGNPTMQHSQDGVDGHQQEKAPSQISISQL